MTVSATEPLAIGGTLAFQPVPGVVVRLQRVMPAAYSVTVENTLLIHELCRSYPTQDDAQDYVDQICAWQRDGFSVIQILDLMGVPL